MAWILVGAIVLQSLELRYSARRHAAVGGVLVQLQRRGHWASTVASHFRLAHGLHLLHRNALATNLELANWRVVADCRPGVPWHGVLLEAR